MSVRKTENSFTGSDGVHTIFYTVWEPEQPKAIFRIVHGMAEHAGRYEAFAEFLAANGFAVCGEDYLGHGRTGEAAGELGYYGDVNKVAGEARKHILEDAHTLTVRMKERCPGLPCILLGHSMGSMIARMYMVLYGADLDAAIVMGTCGTSGPSKSAGAAILLCRLITALKGGKHVSALMQKLAFGTYNDRFKDENDAFAWLSANRENREKYHADPLAGFPLSVTAFCTLMELIQYITTPGSFSAVPRILPVLLISGGDDPVGNYGIGVDEVYQAYRRAGKTNVTMKLYPGMRHEILNEDDRETVYHDILAWTKPLIG